MKALRTTADVAAAAVAWHNRHPLARRIVPDQVHDIGVIDLPLAVSTPPARGKPQLLFAAQALYDASSAGLTRWLRRHGMSPSQAPEDWPRRPLDAEPSFVSRAEAQGLTGRHTATVLCAAVDVDGKRLRLLLSQGGRPSVFGSRAMSTPRIAGATLAAAMLGAVLTFNTAGVAPDAMPSLPRQGNSAAEGHVALASPLAAPIAAAASSAIEESVAQVTPAASTPTLAATADPAAKSAPPPTPDAASADSHVRAHAPAPTSMPAAALAASAPDASAATPADSASQSAPRPRIRFALDDETRSAARMQSRALRASASASASGSAPPSTAERAPQGTVYAIVTKATARKDTAQSQLALMRGLLSQTRTSAPTRLDLMPVGPQWRVAWWPHPSREAANELLERVGARGLRAEVLAF